MPRKRDILAEITAKRARHKKRTPRFDQAMERLITVFRIGLQLRRPNAMPLDLRRETAKYIPIATVGCLEGYFRMAFRDLVDAGSPYRENAIRVSDLRISLEHVVAMQAGKFTLGEFVSHLLPTSSIDDISDAMSTLIGEPFLDRLKHVETDYFWPEPGVVSMESEGMMGPMMRDIRKLFEDRHIFAHELASSVKVNIRAIEERIGAASVLLTGTEALVSELIHAA